MVSPQTAKKISNRATLAESAKAPLKLTMTPRIRLAMAVPMPIREPPTAVAKNTAGKYGVKKTSGRSWANPHRATVASARQKTAKPTLKSGAGWEIPCQPCLNSSINFVIVVVTSRDQRIQNKADPDGNPGFLRDRARQAGWRRTTRLDLAHLPCWRRTGILASTINGGRRHRTAGQQGPGNHPGDQRNLIAYCGDLRCRS